MGLTKIGQAKKRLKETTRINIIATKRKRTERTGKKPQQAERERERAEKFS